MTGIDELRRTLDDHATQVADLDVVSRAAAVHDRIGVVRRRRHAAVAGSVAAVLAVAAGVALLPGSDGPDAAGRIVVGVEAPERMTSLDYTYRFADVVEGDGSRAVVSLASSDEPRLVSWATSGDDDQVRVQASDADPLTITVADFTDFVYVEPGERGRVSVEAAQGRVGLAVYELTEERPEGVTVDGITFRQQIENRTLVDATVGEPGDSDVRLEVSTRAGEVGFAELCAGAPDGSRLRVGRAGEGYFETSCGDGTTFDPGLDVTTALDTPASDAPVRIWLVDEGGNAVDDPDVRLGVGVYQVGAPLQSAAGQAVPHLIEQDGHRWRIDDTQETATESLTMRIPADASRLVNLLVSGPVDEIRAVIDGETPHSFGNRTSDYASFEVGQVDAGSTVKISGRADPGVLIAVVTYVAID